VIRWLKTMMGRYWRHREEERRVAEQVESLEADTQRAVAEADRVLDHHLRLAYDAMVPDRRRRNLGRRPDRRTP
jgi:hypothetical protein